MADTVAADPTATAATAEVESLFSLHGLLTLAMLVLLQVVLGFDNLLYIAIESKRVPEESQSMVRKLGVGLAIFFRIALLFIVVKLVEKLANSFFDFNLAPSPPRFRGTA